MAEATSSSNGPQEGPSDGSSPKGERAPSSAGEAESSTESSTGGSVGSPGNLGSELPPGSIEASGEQLARDISPLLADWQYQPGSITVRKIVGLDGRPKIQMRLDLGVQQMEYTGRPDGTRPHGCESLLDYFEQQLAEHKETNGTELGFHLTRSQCESLRHEAAMYYQRYLSLFVLHEYTGVIRDTARNLRVLDLCSRYAVDEQDRLWLEQYRPYILMMNAKATASILVAENKLPEALRTVKIALRKMRDFFTRFQQPEAFAHSGEARTLKKLARDIRKRMPVDPIESLKKQLERAVKAERYEEAARLRDEIAKMEKV